MDWNSLGDWIWQTLLDLALLAPLGTLMAVVIAYTAYVQRSTADRLTIQQKTEADNRNAWWSRVQWAIDACLSDDRQRRTTGLVAIEQMQASSLATSGDQKLLEAIALEVLEKLEFSAEISLAPDEQPDFMANDQRIGDNRGNTGGGSSHD